jgi:hypothetical protein
MSMERLWVLDLRFSRGWLRSRRIPTTLLNSDEVLREEIHHRDHLLLERRMINDVRIG